MKKISTLLLLIFAVTGSVNVAHAQFLPSAGEDTQFRPQNPMEQTPRLYEVLEIRASGYQFYTETFIIATSNLREGANIRIPGEEIPQALRSLHNTGLFADVKIFKEFVGTDGVNLEIQVTEQPRLQDFTIEGTRRSHRRDLRDKIPLSRGFALTDAAKNQALQTIKRYYEERGYQDTQVEVEVTDTDTLRNRVSLAFHIDRGDRPQIREIVFEGNDSFSDRRLRSNLGDIKRNTWWRLSKQTYNRDDFNEAKQELLAFYRENGFMDARVMDDSVYVYERRRGKQAIGVYFHIDEGPQYHLRNIVWDGNTVYTDDQLSSALGMRKGDVFNEAKFEENLRMNKDNTDVTSLYNDVGYLFFNVQPEFKTIPGDSLDVTLFIVEDEIATVRKVEFSGNVKTHDNVVRRNLRNLPGARYSRSAIIRSIRELAQLGYFNPEAIQPDLDVDYEDKTVDIYYLLDETMGTDNFEFSGGYGGRQFGLILSARVNFNNFSARNIFNSQAWRPLPSGDGQRLSLGVQFTGRGYQNFSFGFQEPWFRGRPNSLGVNLSYSLFSGRSSFYYTAGQGRQEMFSGAVSYGRRLNWPDDYFVHISRIRYQYYNVDRFVYLLGGKANILSFEQEIQRNSVDNPILPRAGSRFSIKFEAAPPMPGFSQYFKAGMSYQFHMPVVGKFVATYGAEFGYMSWFGSSDRSQFNRYFLGGTPLQQQQTFTRENIDMRGYPGGYSGSITPIVDGDEVGGTVYNKYFAELRYPLISTEQVQLIPYLFTEAGNSYLNYKEYDPFNVKRSLGFGARVFMPILGLIDLSYGYRLDGLDAPGVDAGEWQFLFNIGAPF
ncbi:outer membrane protein assembly factor BamA [Balneolaceae bacterium ANBcel3]|nr:outer membrane protein assembly factor BamA [Balneolaceae bacterium ANBcel3]